MIGRLSIAVGVEDDGQVFSCEHTDDKEICPECYQELHYELTNRSSAL